MNHMDKFLDSTHRSHLNDLQYLLTTPALRPLHCVCVDNH